MEAGEELRRLFPGSFNKKATEERGILEPFRALTESQLRIFAKAMGSKVVLVEQKGGEVVFVPPGWVHCVLNLAPCIKLAHDRYILERFPLYAKSAFEVGCGHMYKAITTDYMAWAKTALVQVILP